MGYSLIMGCSLVMGYSLVGLVFAAQPCWGCSVVAGKKCGRLKAALRPQQGVDCLRASAQQGRRGWLGA